MEFKLNTETAIKNVRFQDLESTPYRWDACPVIAISRYINHLLGLRCATGFMLSCPFLVEIELANSMWIALQEGLQS